MGIGRLRRAHSYESSSSSSSSNARGSRGRTSKHSAQSSSSRAPKVEAEDTDAGQVSLITHHHCWCHCDHDITQTMDACHRANMSFPPSQVSRPPNPAIIYAVFHAVPVGSHRHEPVVSSEAIMASGHPLQAVPSKCSQAFDMINEARIPAGKSQWQYAS